MYIIDEFSCFLKSVKEHFIVVKHQVCKNTWTINYVYFKQNFDQFKLVQCNADGVISSLV